MALRFILLAFFLSTVFVERSTQGIVALFDSGSTPFARLAGRPDASTTAEAERFFFASANRERSREGLPELRWNEALAVAARTHAALMASENELSHQLPGEPPLAQRAAQAGARFSSVGENVAIGPQPPEIHSGWMKSPGHRANILGAAYNVLGVGVVEQDGQFYAVEDFARAVRDLSIEEQEKKVAGMLAARGFHVTGETVEARKSCEGGSPRAGGAHPSHPNMQILQFETPDLNSFPEGLERSLRTSKFRSAAVGACPAQTPEGIPRFRVVILLFPAGH